MDDYRLYISTILNLGYCIHIYWSPFLQWCFSDEVIHLLRGLQYHILVQCRHWCQSIDKINANKCTNCKLLYAWFCLCWAVTWWTTALLQTEKSDECSWNSVQIFMVHRGWILKTSVIPWVKWMCETWCEIWRYYCINNLQVPCDGLAICPGFSRMDGRMDEVSFHWST